MRKFAILALLAMGLALVNCASTTTPPNVVNTSTSGNWEAQLTGGTGEASQLNFVTAISVINSGPLDVTGFGFINQGKCFTAGLNNSAENGTASFTTNNAGQVTGTLSFNVQSVNPPGNTLALTGNLTGTSNGTTGTTGTLSNGVVAGTWSLTGGQGDPSCTGQGNFIMCQGAATCTVP